MNPEYDDGVDLDQFQRDLEDFKHYPPLDIVAALIEQGMIVETISINALDAQSYE